MKPFTGAKVVKECFFSASDLLFNKFCDKNLSEDYVICSFLILRALDEYST